MFKSADRPALWGIFYITDGTRINAQKRSKQVCKIQNSAITGSPAYDYTSALRSQALSRNLPELEKRVKDLEKLVPAIATRKRKYIIAITSLYRNAG